MTSKEKYDLIIENNADFLMTSLQASFQNARCTDGKATFCATRFYRNSATTYFYENFGSFDIKTGHFSFQSYCNHYDSYQNQDLEHIFKFLDDVVVIGADDKLIWVDEDYLNKEGIYMVGYFATSPTQYARLLCAQTSN